MNRWFAVVVVGLVMAIASPGVALGTRLKVLADNVNLRAAGTLDAEVVGQVSETDVLMARTFEGEWVEVAVPAGIDLWVHRDFVQNGIVQAKKLNVRAGPGINYTIVGRVNRGDALETRGTFGEWLKIGPPSACSLWVSSKLVEAERQARQAQRRVAPKPAPRPTRARRTPVVVVPDRPVKPVAAPAVEPEVIAASDASEYSRLPEDWELIPLDGQGKKVERQGVLKPVGFLFGKPTRYRLVRVDGTSLETICYLRGNRRQLEDWVGELMLIRGREYWIRDAKYPILVVEQLVPRSGAFPR